MLYFAKTTFEISLGLFREPKSFTFIQVCKLCVTRELRQERWSLKPLWHRQRGCKGLLTQSQHLTPENARDKRKFKWLGKMPENDH